ncbi:hypothetical protein RF11_07544 [Thelohanellus kitauei]|uniref:Winged helix-turn helix domain-containing protein n=1 Tax=Thelohanellus kitauei TaxID=669202 RepID=A0A0C2MRW4_THEKT|nr:hypothetical protein RF11_07544 [Thelohanellus kitauei]
MQVKLVTEILLFVVETMSESVTQSVRDVKDSLNLNVNITKVWRRVQRFGFANKITCPIPRQHSNESVDEIFPDEKSGQNDLILEEKTLLITSNTISCIQRVFQECLNLENITRE